MAKIFPALAFVIAVFLFLYVFAIGVRYDATGLVFGLLDGLLLLLVLYSFKRTFMGAIPDYRQPTT